MVKQKKAKDMKTSEILNEIYDFEGEDRGDKLDEELLSRYPFNYYFKDKFDELEKEIEKLNKLFHHDHKNGKVVVSI